VKTHDLSAQIPRGFSAVEIQSLIDPVSATIEVRSDSTVWMVMAHESTVIIDLPPSRLLYVIPDEPATTYDIRIMRRFR
jgi:hypothetical protein